MTDHLHRGPESLNAHADRVARNRALFAEWTPPPAPAERPVLALVQPEQVAA